MIKGVSALPPNDSQTNVSLVERLQNQDDIAWHHFKDFYGPIIYRFALSRGLDHDLAEEVRSSSYEAVVKQIKNLHYDQTRGRFRNWLLTIASRRIADLSRKRAGLQADTRVLESIETQEDQPHVVWEKQWRQQILTEAFNRVERRMGDEAREVFRRLVRNAEPVPQIAKQLQISENRIYKTKQRSIQMLREEIRFLEHDPLTAG